MDKEENIYYTAESVLAALANHPEFSESYKGALVPSCPKPNDPDGHCRKDFPECEGKATECYQQLLVLTQKGNPYSINFCYYFNSQTREGRVKKNNAGLKRIILVYGLDVSKLCDA
jgi:hypothetical protein